MRSAMMLPDIKPGRIERVYDDTRERVSAFSSIEEDAQRSLFKEAKNAKMVSLEYVSMVEKPKVKLM